MAKIGRPTKLNKQVTERICKYLRAGSYLETACAAAGIDRHTRLAWLKKADIPGPKGRPYRVFRSATEKAMAEGEMRHVGIISTAASSTWQAAAWMLERKHPERYGRRERIDANVNANVSLTDLILRSMKTDGEDATEPTDSASGDDSDA